MIILRLTSEVNMSRVILLQEMIKHPILGKLFKKLTRDEMRQVTQFVYENNFLDNDNYASICNRWLIYKPKPKHYSDMWAIVSQCTEVTLPKRRG